MECKTDAYSSLFQAIRSSSESEANAIFRFLSTGDPAPPETPEAKERRRRSCPGKALRCPGPLVDGTEVAFRTDQSHRYDRIASQTIQLKITPPTPRLVSKSPLEVFLAHGLPRLTILRSSVISCIFISTTIILYILSCPRL